VGALPVRQDISVVAVAQELILPVFVHAGSSPAIETMELVLDRVVHTSTALERT
jgi:hypothetical protein